MKLPDDMPATIAALPTNPAGYPIPWFVDLESGPPGNPDFRVMDGRKLKKAVLARLCWVCGTKLTRNFHTFAVGPMCVINRVSAEPPSHIECVRWSARACPFLVNPHKVRREANMHPDAIEGAGVMIKRNPGVTALVTVFGTRGWEPYPVPPNGVLFSFVPSEVEWWAEGREATLDEVIASIDSGLPALREMATRDGEEAEAELASMVEEAKQWLPVP